MSARKPVGEPDSHFGLALLASLAVHAALVAAWFAPGWFHFEPQPRRAMSLELFGMLTDRLVLPKVRGSETEQKASAASAPSPASAPAPRPKKQVKEKPQPDTPRKKPEKTKNTQERQAPSPVRAALPQEEKEPEPQERPESAASSPSLSSAPSVASRKGADTTQQAETVQAVDKKTLRDLYRRALSKKIAPNVYYPEAAPEYDFMVEPRVAFEVLENGEIKPGSLKIVQSTGDRILDEAVLRAVRASVPLPPPPAKDMSTLVLTLSFRHKNK